MPKSKKDIELKEQIKNQVIELVGNNQTEDASLLLDKYFTETRSEKRQAI